MTSRDVIIQNIECCSEDRIGFNFTGENRLNDMTGANCDHNIETRRWTEGDMEYYTDIWGNTWHRMVGLSAGGEVCKPILENWRDLDILELPDLDNPAHYENARKLGASGTELFTRGWLPGFTFSICRYMRSMETYFMDLIAHRDHIDILHDRVTTLLEGMIDRYGEAGLDSVMTCEDLGTQKRLLMSPDMWNDIFRPLYERITSRAHQNGLKVILHSCGYNWLLLDDLCESGIDCLQFDQPAVYDMPDLSEKLRQHGVGLFSPCDIQHVLPTGDKARIEQKTREMVELFRGGFIAKNYGDLHGIGVDPEWDQWAYDAFVNAGILKAVTP